MIWDFWSKYYENLWVQRISLGPTREAVIERLAPHLKNGMRLLDVGCGTGQLLTQLKDFGQRQAISLELVGADASAGMVEQAMVKLPGATIIHGKLGAFSTPEPFDVVTCTHALPYMGDIEEVLAAFATLLRPGGLLLVSQAARESHYDRIALSLVKLTTGPADYHPLARITDQASSAFDIVHAGTLDLPLPMPSVAMVVLRKKGGVR